MINARNEVLTLAGRAKYVQMSKSSLYKFAQEG